MSKYPLNFVFVLSCPLIFALVSKYPIIFIICVKLPHLYYSHYVFDTNNKIRGSFIQIQRSLSILTQKQSLGVILILKINEKLTATNWRDNLTHILKFRDTIGTFHNLVDILTLVIKFMSNFWHFSFISDCFCHSLPPLSRSFPPVKVFILFSLFFYVLFFSFLIHQFFFFSFSLWKRGLLALTLNNNNPPLYDPFAHWI